MFVIRLSIKSDAVGDIIAFHWSEPQHKNSNTVALCKLIVSFALMSCGSMMNNHHFWMLIMMCLSDHRLLRCVSHRLRYINQKKLMAIFVLKPTRLVFPSVVGSVQSSIVGSARW